MTLTSAVCNTLGVLSSDCVYSHELNKCAEFIPHDEYFFVYYESIKRELKIRPIYECRCDERLQTKPKEFTLLAYTGLIGGLEHLKIETRLIDEKIVNVLGEDVT